MAVYIRFADEEQVAPINVGQMTNPSDFTWNVSNQRANATDKVVFGTSIIQWWYFYDMGFKAFFDSTFALGMSGSTQTYTKDFKLYTDNRYKLRLEFEVYDFGLEFGRRYNGSQFHIYIVKPDTNLLGYRPYTDWYNMMREYPTPVDEDIISDILDKGFGPSLVCNPHIQVVPENVALITSVSDKMRRYNTQGAGDETFSSFYDYGTAANRTTGIEVLFYKSGQDFGPNSDEDGGFGDFNDDTDTIPLPGVPSISALDTGLVRMYNPTAQELQQLSEFIWTRDFFTNVIKNFSDPMQAIVSLSISPVAPTVSQQDVSIVVGNIPAFLENEQGGITPIMAKPLTSQYVTVNCGSIKLNEYWGSALDYSPYSKCEIYLPYIGVQSLAIDDVMGATLTLQYNVDLLTGICTAQLKCTKAQHMDYDSVLYHWSGNMISNLPISGSNFAQVITALTSSIVSAGIPIVTGAGGAAIASGVIGGVMNMMNAKAQVQKSGSISMQSGSLDNQTPYLILTRPIQSKAANYPAYKGWTTNITAEIGSLSGYTEVEYVHVEISGATDDEKTEIERILKEGFIV